MISPLPFWPLVSSLSDGLSVDLDYAGNYASIGPIATAAGSAPPAFDSKRTIEFLQKNVNLDPLSPVHPTLQIDAVHMVDQAESAGFAVDAIGTSATSNIASLNLLLTDTLPFDLSVLGLAATATFIKASADASYVVGPNTGFIGGGASFGSLVIDGALIGKELTFKGDAAPNTVIFKSPTVTITLDKQEISGFYPPVASEPIAVMPGNRITTDALDIQLNNAHLFGHAISGNIDIGQASATLWPVPPIVPLSPT